MKHFLSLRRVASFIYTAAPCVQLACGKFFSFILFTLLISHFSLLTLHSQTPATEIETLLSTPEVTYAHAARFVLEASEALKTSDQEEAFNYAAEQKWLPQKVAANDTARLDSISLLLMGSFKEKGGLFYKMTKNPHYAYRELTYKEVIQGRADPAMKVSGEKLLFITSRLIAQREVREEKEALKKLKRQKEEAAASSAAEAAVRRETMAAEINAILEEQNVADTVAEATDAGVVIRLSNIQFTADSTQLPPTEVGKLVEIANILKTIPNRKIQVAGHTAEAGSREGQRTVSLERARVVAAYLVALGAHDASDIVSVGHGADMPIASNRTPEGMALNRRVEIIILEN